MNIKQKRYDPEKADRVATLKEIVALERTKALVSHNKLKYRKPTELHNMNPGCTYSRRNKDPYTIESVGIYYFIGGSRLISWKDGQWVTHYFASFNWDICKPSLLEVSLAWDIPTHVIAAKIKSLIFPHGLTAIHYSDPRRVDYEEHEKWQEQKLLHRVGSYLGSNTKVLPTMMEDNVVDSCVYRVERNEDYSTDAFVSDDWTKRAG